MFTHRAIEESYDANLPSIKTVSEWTELASSSRFSLWRHQPRSQSPLFELPMNECMTVLLPRAPADLLVNGHTRVISTPNQALLIAPGARVTGCFVGATDSAGDLALIDLDLAEMPAADYHTCGELIHCLPLPIVDAQFVRFRLLFRELNRSAAQNSELATQLILPQLIDLLQSTGGWLLRGRQMHAANKSNRRLPMRRSVVEEIKRILIDHPDETPRLAKLARAASLSPYYLARAFSSETGYSTKRFVYTLRMRQAFDDIVNGAYPTAQVARDCGFSELRHLNRALRLQFGFVPESMPGNRAYV